MNSISSPTRAWAPGSAPLLFLWLLSLLCFLLRAMGCAVGEMRDGMVVYLLGNSQVYWVKTKPALVPLLLHLLPADFTEGQVLASAHSDITHLHSTSAPGHKFNPSLGVLASSSFSPARSSSILRSVEIPLPSCMF